MLISIESILYILFLEKYFFLKFYQYSPYHGGRRRHTAAMGPHPRQQSTQQSTNIICDRSTSLKLDFIYLLLVILLLMHVAWTSTSNNDDAAMGQWAPCSPLNDIADSNRTLPLPMIYSTRAGRGAGGKGVADK